MASNINDFGSASNGLDRAEIHKAPPVHTDIDARPSLDTLDYEKPSIRHSIRENALSVVVHPRYGLNKIRATIQEKKEATRREKEPRAKSPQDDAAPTLAPEPLLSSVDGERLFHDVGEKPKHPSAKEFLKHPVVSLQSTVQDQRGKDFAENVMRAEIPHGADVHVVRQADKISQAINAEDARDETEKFARMKQLRQDAFVRWTIDRHVRKVVRTNLPKPKPQAPTLTGPARGPKWSTYLAKRFDYELERHAEYYLDNGDKFPQPDRHLLASSLERFVMALVPAQDTFMWLRGLSHWDNPWESAGYMVLYLLLLLFSQLTRMMILFVIGRTLWRRYHPPDVEQMRQRIEHSENKDNTAKDLIELVTQYGLRGWVDRVIDIAGPTIFDRLERGADLLETMQNFHAWRNPIRTRRTACALLIWWLVITLAPAEMLVKMSFLGGGFDFFVLSPLAVRYPKYRLVMSPATWLFWEVPTHAEWAMARLQAEARQYLEHDALQEGLVGRFDCKGDTPGKLIITTKAIAFDAKDTSANWMIAMSDIKSIQKVSFEAYLWIVLIFTDH